MMPVDSVAPAPSPVEAPSCDLTAASLVQQAQAFCNGFPQDRDARLLLAESLRGTSMDDLAETEYEKLLENCPANERLSTAEYAADHNAEVWRAYAGREIQRGREIVRMIRQATPLYSGIPIASASNFRSCRDLSLARLRPLVLT